MAARFSRAMYFCRHLHFFILFITGIFKSHVKQFYRLIHTVNIWTINYHGFLFFCLRLLKAHRVPGSRRNAWCDHLYSLLESLQDQEVMILFLFYRWGNRGFERLEPGKQDIWQSVTPCMADCPFAWWLPPECHLPASLWGHWSLRSCPSRTGETGIDVNGLFEHPTSNSSFIIDLIFKSSFRFAEKLYGRHRVPIDLPRSPRPVPPLISVSH